MLIFDEPVKICYENSYSEYSWKKRKMVWDLIQPVHVKHKILTEEAKEDLLLAKLIDEAMEDKGEVKKEKVFQYVKKHARQV